MFLQKMKNHDGFTLVELIVVIAIMAILAGVAVPAYSGYIEKADAAADSVLLDAVNDAFVASVIGSGGDPLRLSSASAPISGGQLGTVTAVGGGVNGTLFAENFETYFTRENPDAEFKKITALYFSKAEGIFKEDAMKTFSYTGADGKTYTFEIAESDIQNFSNTTFWNNPDLGVTGLTSKVDFVTGFATDLMSDPDSTISQYIMADSQKAAMASALGYKSYAEMQADPNSPYGTMIQSWMEKIMKEDPTITPPDAEALAEKQLLANYTVLSSAQTATNMSADSVKNMLTSGDAKALIKTGDAGTVLTQAALAYGMYTAYAYQSGDDDLIASTSNPDAIMDSLQDKGFQDYMQTAQAQADLEGYLSALTMASTAAQGNSTTVEDVLTNGYSDPDIQALITQIMGSQS